MTTDIVFVPSTNNEPMVSSREVAEKFDKEHTDVLRAMTKQVLPFISEQFSGRNFASATYIDEQGKPRKEFHMTKDGFIILAMGFTGEEAMRWKETFIGAFNDAIGSVAELKAELARRDEVILRLQAGKKKRVGEGYVLVPHEEPCFEGHIPKTTYERVPSSEISDEQRKEILIAHNARIVTGIFKTTIQEVGMKAAFEAFYNSFKNFLPN